MIFGAQLKPLLTPFYDVLITGFHLLLDSPCSCLSSYASHSEVSPAYSVSSTLVICRKVLVTDFTYPNVSISFNGIDFVSVELSKSSLVYSDSHYHSGAVLSEKNEARFRGAAQLPTSVVSAVCDGDAVVAIPFPEILSIEQYFCSFESTTPSVGRASISEGVVYCSTPSMAPGKYNLTVSDSLKIVSVVSSLQCFQPKIFYLTIDSPTYYNLSGNMRLYGVNLDYSLKYFVTFNDRKEPVVLESSASGEVDMNAIIPGVYNITVLAGAATIFNLHSCISPSLLLTGGTLNALNADENCELAPSKGTAYSPPTLEMADKISFWPRSGPSSGYTVVEVFLNNFGTNLFSWCLFGNVTTAAQTISNTKIACTLPELSPQTLLFSLQDNFGKLYNCGNFEIYPSIKIFGLNPSIVSRFQETRLYISATGLPIAHNELFCHYRDNVVPALVIQLGTLLCDITVMGWDYLSISIGSKTESWSNSVSVDIVQFSPALIMSPIRGSLRGGTPVAISHTFKSKFASKLWCQFGSTGATAAAMSASSFQCLAPAGASTGKVRLAVLVSKDGPELGFGFFSYDEPAEITSGSPSVIIRGSTESILVNVSNC